MNEMAEIKHAVEKESPSLEGFNVKVKKNKFDKE